MLRQTDAGREAPQGLADAMGGPLGIAETALPAVAFVVAYSASGSDTDIAVMVAVGVAVLFTIARLARGESVQFALSGLVGIAFAAFIASRSDKAEDFFLPGLLANAAYATAFLVSLAIGRPLVGVIVGTLDGEGSAWRENPVRVRAFARATWLWAGLFLTRLAVQLPLYLAGAVVALGVARTAMGLPLFALGLWLTYRIVRAHREPAASPKLIDGA
jgi:hypothetical protein